jgi:hypothetical protein
VHSDKRTKGIVFPEYESQYWHLPQCLNLLLLPLLLLLLLLLLLNHSLFCFSQTAEAMDQ